MQLGLLSHGQLTFDPFKPIILRGLPTEDASTLFAGNVVLNLTKATKISNVSVTMKSHAVTYWPEGIGARGARLTQEKPLGEQTVEILASNIEKMIILPAGKHRFSFVFVVPNSTVATIEDTFGRVKHVVEAQVQRPGIVMLSNWSISKPVMVLRTYMSNSLLINNSLNNLSRTFEKQTVYGDIEILIEAAAFSSGDLFYIRMIIEPQLKHTRIEHMEVTVTETRKYCVPEMKAWRNDVTIFPMPFAGSVRLAEFGEVDVTTDQLKPMFDKNGEGIELVHDFAHRLAFYAPTCQQNIRHTTYIKEISFKHRLEINLTLSYMDIEGNRQTLLSRNNSSLSLFDDMSSIESPPPSPSPQAPIRTLTPPPAAHFANSSRIVGNPSVPRISSGGGPNNNGSLPSSRPTSPTNPISAAHNNINHSVTWQNVLLRLHKTSTTTKSDKDDGRSRETITLDSPITVFDCRLKEDYGKLPSYFESGATPTILNHAQYDKKQQKMISDSAIKMTKEDEKKHNNQPRPYLCSCYNTFCREMELASQSLYLPDSSPSTHLLDRIPSKPPPDYEL